MDNYERNYLSKRPQSLCKMCGKCCRVATTSLSYETMKVMAKNGDQGAIDFLELFVPYESIEAARKVDSDTVDNIIKHLLEDGNYKDNSLTFYYCKYIRDDNLCSNYENRKTLCKHFPSSPWAIVPPGCGFEGWLFLKREEDKQKIRKSKEDLLELQLLKCKTKDFSTLQKISAVEEKILKNIEMYKKYGAENW